MILPVAEAIYFEDTATGIQYKLERKPSCNWYVYRKYPEAYGNNNDWQLLRDFINKHHAVRFIKQQTF